MQFISTVGTKARVKSPKLYDVEHKEPNKIDIYTIPDRVNHDMYGCMKRTEIVHAFINVQIWSAIADNLRCFVRIHLLYFKKAFDHVDHSIVIRGTPHQK